MPIRISPRSGGYRRIMPFLFSSPPRRRLEYGSAKHVSMPGPSRRRVRRANPAPSSHVTATRAGRRRTLGDGNPSGNRETRRPPAATPATPPVAAWKTTRPAFTAMAVGVDPTVDGLRAHAHGGVVGEQDARPAADGRRRPAATQPFGHPRPQAFA